VRERVSCVSANAVGKCCCDEHAQLHACICTGGERLLTARVFLLKAVLWVRQMQKCCMSALGVSACIQAAAAHWYSWDTE
jgi:hypothetical protein